MDKTSESKKCVICQKPTSIQCKTMLGKSLYICSEECANTHNRKVAEGLWGAIFSKKEKGGA